MKKKIFIILVTLLSILIFAKALFNVSSSPKNDVYNCKNTIIGDDDDDLDAY